MGTIENVRANMRSYNIINPILTFEGDLSLSDITKNEYDITKDLFYINSLVDKDGKNKFEEFLNKYFYEKLEINRLSKSVKELTIPLLLTSLNKDKDGRHLRFDYYYLIYNLLEDKKLYTEEVRKDELTFVKTAIEYFRKQIVIVDDYKRKRLNSEDPEVVVMRYLVNHGVPAYNRGELSMEEMAKIDKIISDADLDSYTNNMMNILRVLRNVRFELENAEKNQKGYNQDQMVKDFFDCFNYDKLLLCFMKKVIDHEKVIDKNQGVIDNAMIEVTQFLSIIDEQKVKFNPSIKIYDEKQKKQVHYNVNDLRVEYNRFNKKYKDIMKIGELSPNQVEKMKLERNLDNIYKFQDFITKEQEKIIETDWEILAPGEKVEDVRGYAGNKPKTNQSINKNIIDDDEIQYRKYVFSQTNYSRKIIGKDKFNGYIGYIYPNGLVLFERYQEKGGLKNNATYVMNIDNFVKFSKLTKSEIIEYISNSSNKDVKRLYHNDNWYIRLQETINKIEVTDESIMRVETLPECGGRK